MVAVRHDEQRGWYAELTDEPSPDEPVPAGFVSPSVDSQPRIHLEQGHPEPLSKRLLEKEAVIELYSRYLALAELEDCAADRLNQAELTLEKNITRRIERPLPGTPPHRHPTIVTARQEWSLAHDKAQWAYQAWLAGINQFARYPWEERLAIELMQGWWTPIKFIRQGRDYVFCYHRDRTTVAQFNALHEGVIWVHRIVLAKNGQIAG